MADAWPQRQLDALLAEGAIGYQRCEAALAKFKVPRRVVCLDAFPTTPSANGERVQRQALRRRAAELIQDA